MTTQGLQKMILKCEQTDSLILKPDRGRKLVEEKLWKAQLMHQKKNAAAVWGAAVHREFLELWAYRPVRYAEF